MQTQSIIEYIKYPLWNYWYDEQDPRTAHLPLVHGPPYLVLTIMGMYLYFVTSLGPRMMKNRKPFNLKPLMLAYNFSMALSNAYFVFLVARQCEYGQRFIDWKYPDKRVYNAEIKWMINMGWWYWMTKFLDLFDTIFFVLKKKHETHVSFLHLYHHTVVPIFGYLCLKHNGMLPSTAFFCLINGTIHVIMYSYYGLSLMGPAVRKYLWWKRYLTQLQIAQFMIYIGYGIVLTAKQQGYPPFWFYFGLTQPFFFFKLFYDFYKKSYSRESDNKLIDKKLS